MDSGGGLAAAALFAMLAAAAFWYLFPQRRGPGLPPGPRGLPLFGSLFQMPDFLANPAKIRRLAELYGPVFTLRVGSRPLIVVTDARIAQEALVEQGAAFASRPLRGVMTLFSNGNRTVNTRPYGPYWRAVRRAMVASIGVSRLADVRLADVRRRTVDRLVKDLAAAAAVGGGAVAVRAPLRFAVFSILSFMCFGQWLEDATIRQLEETMRKTMKLVIRNTQSLSDFVPVLRFVGVRARPSKVALDHLEARHRLLMPLIQDSIQRKDLDHPDCYIRVLVQQVREQQELSEEDLVALVSEFLNAGADTTALTLEWTLGCLVQHPEVQDKLHDELQTAVHDLDESEAVKLPYLQAVVKEVLRRHPPTYMTLPHTAMQAASLAGYTIPANVMVVFHTYNMANDPSFWERPEVFDPGRFMPGGTAYEVDFNTSTVQGYAPFGAGRRMCPGLSLAWLHLSLIIARLVQAFEWKPKEGEPVDMTPKLELTLLMKHPLEPVLVHRRK